MHQIDGGWGVAPLARTSPHRLRCCAWTAIFIVERQFWGEASAFARASAGTRRHRATSAPGARLALLFPEPRRAGKDRRRRPVALLGALLSPDRPRQRSPGSRAGTAARAAAQVRVRVGEARCTAPREAHGDRDHVALLRDRESGMTPRRRLSAPDL